MGKNHDAGSIPREDAVQHECVHVKIQIEVPPKLRGWLSCHEIWRLCAGEVAPAVPYVSLLVPLPDDGGGRLWITVGGFPRTGGRVLCVHGAVSVHGLLVDQPFFGRFSRVGG